MLPADKGNAAVIMDTLKYEDNITNFLSHESTYRLLEKDPTPSLQHKMNATLLQLKKDCKIPRCSSGRTQSIYGLLKIHKPDIPLRPIVSSYAGLRNLPPPEVLPHSDAVGPAAPLIRSWMLWVWPALPSFDCHRQIEGSLVPGISLLRTAL